MRNQAKVQLAMSIRMRDHIAYWNQKKNQMEALVNDLNQEPQSLFERLLTLVRRAGVHSHHIQNPLEELGTKMQEYSAKCKRFRTT